MVHYEMPLTLGFPTPEQAEVIRTATAEAITRFPDRAADLQAAEDAVLSQSGDGLPGPVLESLVGFIRSGLQAGGAVDDQTGES